MWLTSIFWGAFQSLEVVSYCKELVEASSPNCVLSSQVSKACTISFNHFAILGMISWKVMSKLHLLTCNKNSCRHHIHVLLSLSFACQKKLLCSNHESQFWARETIHMHQQKTKSSELKFDSRNKFNRTFHPCFGSIFWTGAPLVTLGSMMVLCCSLKKMMKKNNEQSSIHDYCSLQLWSFFLLSWPWWFLQY